MLSNNTPVDTSLYQWYNHPPRGVANCCSLLTTANDLIICIVYFSNHEMFVDMLLSQSDMRSQRVNYEHKTVRTTNCGIVPRIYFLVRRTVKKNGLP